MAKRNLFQGCTGSDVKTLQRNLKKLGYYKSGSVDGIFGPLTKAAVVQFQKAHKLYQDGVVGPKTRAALSAAIKKKTNKNGATGSGSGANAGKSSKTSTGSSNKPTVKTTDPTTPRRATVSIKYDPTGKNNTRSSSKMAPYLEAFTYADPATGESDTASLDLCNIDMIFAGKWLPKKGDKFTATINTYNWAKAGTLKQFKCGTFCCDDRNFTFPGNVATINGTSVPEKQAFRHTKRSKTWKDITIREIARRVAQRYKIKLVYDASEIKIKSMEQSKKEDCSFLNDLCTEYGLYIKVYRGQVVIYDAARYEKKKAVANIKLPEIISGDYNSTLSGTYTGATIKYTKGNDKTEYTYTVGSGNRILVINEKVDSLSDAKIKAKAKLAEENRKAETLKLSIAAPDKTLYSGACFNFKDAYEMSGKYFIDKIIHKVDGSGGYTIDIEAHKVVKAITK